MRDKALGNHLVSEGKLKPDAYQQALDQQMVLGGRLDTVLLEMGLATEPILLDALGACQNTPAVSGTELAAASADAARMIPPRLAKRFELVPFLREGQKVRIATLNPGDLLVEDEVALLTGCMVSSFVTLEVRLYEVLARFYQIEMSPLLESVSKRLNAGTISRRVRRPAPTPAPRPITAQPEPAPTALEPAPAPVCPPIPLDSTPPPMVTEVAVSDEDLQLFPSMRTTPGVAVAEPPVPADAAPTLPAAVEEPSIGDRLATASVALQNAEMREDIADALLEFCEPFLRRRMLLVVRQDSIIGWRGEGDGVDPTAVRAIEIPLADPSVFVGLTRGQTFWLGAVPPMPRNIDLILGLGGKPPRDCVILPVTMRTKTFCFLYGDNAEDGVGGTPIAELRRLVAKASLAFEVYLLKGKIRTL